MPMTPAPEDVLTIAPPPRLRISGISYFMHRKTPWRLVSMIRFHSASSYSAVGAAFVGRIPALLKAKSSRPNASTVLSRAAFTSSARVTSHRTASARPPCSSIMRIVSWLPCSDTSATTTLAPSRANASAAARPMPLAAPVTKATFPAKLPFRSVVIPNSFPCCPASRPACGRSAPSVASTRGLSSARSLPLAGIGVSAPAEPGRNGGSGSRVQYGARRRGGEAVRRRHGQACPGGRSRLHIGVAVVDPHQVGSFKEWDGWMGSQLRCVRQRGDRGHRVDLVCRDPTCVPCSDCITGMPRAARVADAEPTSKRVDEVDVSHLPFTSVLPTRRNSLDYHSNVVKRSASPIPRIRMVSASLHRVRYGQEHWRLDRWLRELGAEIRRAGL